MTNQRSRIKFFPRFSFSQVMASALAAGSAALAARYLGVIGTVVGAVIVGGLATVATTLYEHSIERTNAALRKAAARSARHVEGIVATLPALAPTTKALARLRKSAQESGDAILPRQHSLAQDVITGRRTLRPVTPMAVIFSDSSMFNRVIATEPVALRGNRTVPRWKIVAGITAAILITAMATVTGIELTGGTSLAELLHGPAKESGSRKVTIEQPVIVQHTSVQPTVRITTSAPPTPTPSSSPAPSSSPNPTQPIPSTLAPSPDPEHSGSGPSIPNFPQTDRD